MNNPSGTSATSVPDTECHGRLQELASNRQRLLEMREHEGHLVAQLRSLDVPWSHIAAALNCSRQGVQQRWGVPSAAIVDAAQRSIDA